MRSYEDIMKEMNTLGHITEHNIDIFMALARELKNNLNLLKTVDVEKVEKILRNCSLDDYNKYKDILEKRKVYLNNEIVLNNNFKYIIDTKNYITYQQNNLRNKQILEKIKNAPLKNYYYCERIVIFGVEIIWNLSDSIYKPIYDKYLVAKSVGVSPDRYEQMHIKLSNDKTIPIVIEKEMTEYSYHEKEFITRKDPDFIFNILRSNDTLSVKFQHEYHEVDMINYINSFSKEEFAEYNQRLMYLTNELCNAEVSNYWKKARDKEYQKVELYRFQEDLQNFINQNENIKRK